MITQQQIIEKLRDVGFKPDGPDSSSKYLKNRDFKARIVTRTNSEPSNSGWINKEYLIIQLSEKKTFDRWANSINFEVDLTDWEPDLINLKKTLAHARKIIRSGVFDFNRYFYTINLDP